MLFDDDKNKRCIPLADAMPAPTPPPPQDKFAPFTVDDLERMATLSALLSSKEACLDAITELHDRAEAGGTVELRDYAMRIVQLEEINRALVPALAAAVTPMMGAKAEAAVIDREAVEIVAQQAPPFSAAPVRSAVLKCVQLCITIRKAVEQMRSGALTLTEARLQVHSALLKLKPADGSPAWAAYREIEEHVKSLFR